MNLKKFKGLPKNLQALLMDAQKQVEVDYLETWSQHEANEKQKAMKAGMKPLKFSEEEAKRFFDMAYSAAWEDQFKKHPDIAPKLKKLMSK
jgi:TRAP-type C4-dicarboxylate transport system substrate-binding protein